MFRTSSKLQCAQHVYRACRICIHANEPAVLPKCRILSEYFRFIALSSDSRTNDAISRIFGPTLAIQYNAAAISTADQFDACALMYAFGGCGYLFGIRNCKTVYNYYLWIFVY